MFKNKTTFIYFPASNSSVVKKKKLTKQEALTKVKETLGKAKALLTKNKELSKKYVQKARKVAMKVRLKTPPEIKRQFCKHCKTFLIPGKNVRVRTQTGKLVYYCLECKKHWRMEIKKPTTYK